MVMEDATNTSLPCEDASIPTSKELFQGDNRRTNIILLGVATVVAALTFLIYVDMLIFVTRHFKLRARQVRTTWIISIFPVFSLCSYVGAFIPRASTIVDLVMDVFLSSCLYQFLLLLEDYIGHEHLAWEKVKHTKVRINAPPVLCCFICLPQVHITKKFLKIVRFMVMQVTIIRPILSFIAAVMWADGAFIPGYVAVDNAFVYFEVLNLLSSCTAITGLFLMRKSFDVLLKPYQPGGKFMAIQFVILLTIIPSLIIGLLVSQNVIACQDVLPSKSRGDRILHGFVLCLMLPLIVLARFFYRRQWEGRLMHDASQINKSDMDNGKDKKNYPEHLQNDADTYSNGFKSKINSNGLNTETNEIFSLAKPGYLNNNTTEDIEMTQEENKTYL